MATGCACSVRVRTDARLPIGRLELVLKPPDLPLERLVVRLGEGSGIQRESSGEVPWDAGTVSWSGLPGTLPSGAGNIQLLRGLANLASVRGSSPSYHARLTGDSSPPDRRRGGACPTWLGVESGFASNSSEAAVFAPTRTPPSLPAADAAARKRCRARSRRRAPGRWGSANTASSGLRQTRRPRK